jgi:hypothetical protein
VSLLDLNPEQAVAMLRQERLQWVDKRAQATAKIETIEAQIAGAEMVLQMQARASQAAADPAVAPEEKVD